ncbi:uncharacterized protein LOC122883133 [Tachysurus ichikawai]
MDASENKDPDQQLEAPHNGTEEEELHRSGRQRTLTEKMHAYKKEEAMKKERRLIQLYEQWKDLARNTREELKTDISESQLRKIEAHKCEKLKAGKDLKAARARLQAYDKEMTQEGSIHSSDSNAGEHDVDVLVPQHVDPLPMQRPTDITATFSPTTSDISYLARAMQDSITLNRLPATEPPVFNGDPIQFIEWKSAFVSLIGGKAIPSADKLHYLKRYVDGPARKSLDGIFYRNDDEAYKDAWNKLNQRYGQPFAIQKAFREKLAKWPKIQPKDSEGFREFSDFLNACHQAMPHVKGLEILNDCDENQKLVCKLPDWAASRWNRDID